MRLRLIVFIFSILFCSVGVAQDVIVSGVTEKIDGKEYYIHTVVKGESVWKIAKAYSVTSEEIIADNPKAEKKIKPGQKLRIIKKESKVVVTQQYSDHVVVKGESLYSIAKKYSITIDEIMKANPGISDVIKPDQVIKIPATAVITLKADTLTQHQKDSLKADSAEKYDCNKPKLLDTYNVALMIPFYLDNMYEIKTDDPDIKEKDANDLTSFTFIQFYEGVLMAIDSLKKNGLNAKIYVYDVRNDSAATMKILQKPEFEKMHLIIGPFFENAIKVVADFAKKKKIYMVDPVTIDDSLYKDNPYMINASPSIEMQLKQLSKYLVGRYPGSPVIVVHTNKETEKKYVCVLNKALRDEEMKAGLKDSSFREVVYGVSGIGGITRNFSATDTNIVITLANGEVFLSNYTRLLSEVAEKNKMIVFGLPSWKNYDQISTEYFLEMYLHMFSSSFIDYQNENVKRFVTDFREEYKTEPEKYAFAGFDITTYFLKALMLYGSEFGKCLDQFPGDSYLQTSFIFSPRNKQDGQQNTFLNIFRFEEYQLVDVRKHPTIKKIEKKN